MDYNTSTSLQLLFFIAIIFFALILHKYYIISDNKITNTQLNQIQPENKTRCHPSIDNKIDNIDDTININKNDLNIVDQKFNIYNNTQYINNDGFKNELGNFDELYKEPTADLDEFYFSKQFKENPFDVNEMDKADKTDLPIVNVPLHFLINNKPLRLSEKPL